MCQENSIENCAVLIVLLWLFNCFYDRLVLDVASH